MEKILLIEPDNILCQEVIRHIRLAGYHNVFYALNGEEGLSILQKEKPHLVILNMSLPDYFGLEIPELITSHSETYGKPVIILLWDSFFVLGEPSILEKKHRIVHLIKKPYQPQDLLDPVQNALNPEIVSAPTSSMSSMFRF